MPASLHRQSSLHNALRSASGRQQLRSTSRLAYSHDHKHTHGITKAPSTPRASTLRTPPNLDVKASGPVRRAVRRSARNLGARMSGFEARLLSLHLSRTVNKPSSDDVPGTDKSLRTGGTAAAPRLPACWVDIRPPAVTELQAPNLPLLGNLELHYPIHSHLIQQLPARSTFASAFSSSDCARCTLLTLPMPTTWEMALVDLLALFHFFHFRNCSLDLHK